MNVAGVAELRAEPLDGSDVADGFAGLAQHRHRRVQRANRGQHALEADLAVGVDVQLVTAQLDMCPDPLHAVGDHVLEPHQRAVRLAVVAVEYSAVLKTRLITM